MSFLEGISSQLYDAAHYFFVKEEESPYEKEPTFYNGHDTNTESAEAPQVKEREQTEYIDKTSAAKLLSYVKKMTQGLDGQKALCQKEIKEAFVYKSQLQKELNALLKKRHALDAERRSFSKRLSPKQKARKAAIKKEIAQIDNRHRKAAEDMALTKSYIKDQTKKMALIETLLSQSNKIEQVCSLGRASQKELKALSDRFDKKLLEYSQLNIHKVYNSSLLAQRSGLIKV